MAPTRSTTTTTLDLADLDGSLLARYRLRHLAERTVGDYRDALGRLTKGLAMDLRRVPTLDDLTVRSVQSVVARWAAEADQRGRPWATTTSDTYLRTYHAIGGHLAATLTLPANPLDGLSYRRASRRMAGHGPDALDDGEIVAVLRVLDSHDPTQRVTRAIVLLGYECGPRESEYLAMRIEDVHLVMSGGLVLGPMVRVEDPAKGGPVRELPLGVRAEDALRAYLGARTSGPLFPGRRGEPLTGDAIYGRLRRAGKRAGVRLSTQRLRRTAATWYATYGATSPFLDVVFGWAPEPGDVRSGSYVLPTLEQLLYAHQSRLSPWDRLELRAGRPAI